MSTINNISVTENGNPWKGLNFYHEGEVIYGRDQEIQSLSLYVINNTQTVLYGKSGIGKSSIINAGVFPAARNEGLYPIPIRLKHDSETSYASQIRMAFEKSGIGIKKILDPIDESNETLWEFLHRNTFFDLTTGFQVRPLIVLDQFEEIFTLQKEEKKIESFFSELADLLNEVTPAYIANNTHSEQSETTQGAAGSGFTLDFGVEGDGNEATKAYVSESLFNIVFTIREDFLSYLERYTKYIPVMKTNRFALLPINGEQAKDIIMKPVEGLVDIDVAKLIIEKVTGRTDSTVGDAAEIEVDAAVLSLFLSRLYIKKGEAPKITAAIVNEFSKAIIKDFYVESVSDLPVADIEKLEDQLLTYDGRRNNVSYHDLICEGISDQVIKTLVEERKLLRQFSYQNDMRIEFIHDILCPIVDDRVDDREQIAKEIAAKEREEEKERQLKKKDQELLLYYRAIRIIFLFVLAYLSITSAFYKSEGSSLCEQICLKYSFFMQTMIYPFLRPFMSYIYVWLPLFIIVFISTYWVLIRRTRWSRIGICARTLGYIVVAVLIWIFLYWLICSCGASTIWSNIIAIIVSVAIYIFMVAGKDTATMTIQTIKKLFFRKS